MSFNLRYGLANDGENSWSQRQNQLLQLIEDYEVDVLGIQEALRFQLDTLLNRFPEYDYVGVGRDGGMEGEYAAILFNRHKLKVERSGNFWLSDTPDVPSMSWGNRYIRICTWADFTLIPDGAEISVYNTHLDHESQRSRYRSVRLISDSLGRLDPESPLILMGDFNAGEKNPAMKYLFNPDSLGRQLEDTFRIMHPDGDLVGTFHGFSGNRDGDKIDYILTSPAFKVKNASILTESLDERYPSDHFPVFCVLTL